MTSMLEAIRDHEASLYDEVEVEIEFLDRVLGGQPQKLEWLMARIDAKTNRKEYPAEIREEVKADAREKLLDTLKARQQGEEVEGDPEGDAEKQGWNVFHQDETGLYLEARVVKANLKSACTQLNVFSTYKGGGGKVGSKTTHDTGMLIDPPKLYFQREGVVVKEPDGLLEMPIHVMTAQGPRTSLSRCDYLEKVSLSFTLKLVRDVGDKTLTLKRLPQILALAQDIGLGAKRSQGFGKYKIVRADHTNAK